MNLQKWLKMDLQENLLIQKYGITEIRPQTRKNPVINAIAKENSINTGTHQ